MMLEVGSYWNFVRFLDVISMVSAFCDGNLPASLGSSWRLLCTRDTMYIRPHCISMC